MNTAGISDLVAEGFAGRLIEGRIGNSETDKEDFMTDEFSL